VALVRTDVSEEIISSINRVERISELGKASLVIANIVPSSLIIFTQMMYAIRSSETSILPSATRPYIPEDGILQSHRWAL
jgi:hypothetical protein